ncbi:dTMP kinase [Acetobacteraceae bacterium]|nr:dTMP kinase [Acetobacteraceae bacterium]
MESKNGLFITLEGGEGAGKSTQARLLASWLEKSGYEVCLTREPGGTKGAEALRDLLLFSDYKFSSRVEVALLFAARLDHIEKVILPALENGKVVICDRFLDSTIAYQGYGIQKGEQETLYFIKSLHKFLTVSPDLTFLLDISVEEGMKRAKKRNERLDRYEAEKHTFHGRVRQGFLELSKLFNERIFVVNGSARPEQIQLYLQERIEKVLEDSSRMLFRR